jgi:hypothetical protein
MDFPSLIHLLGTVREIDPDRRIVIFGSASILASFPEETDEKQWLALTNDADFILSPWEDAVAVEVNRVIGKGRAFHSENGYYADIVKPAAFDQFPPEFESRLVKLEEFPNVFALEPHDMAIAKIFAGRPKDILLLSILLARGKLSEAILRTRLWFMPMDDKLLVKTHQVLRDVVAAARELGYDVVCPETPWIDKAT